MRVGAAAPAAPAKPTVSATAGVPSSQSAGAQAGDACVDPGVVGAGCGIAFDVDGDAVTDLGLAQPEEGGAPETQLAEARRGAGESDSAHGLVLEPAGLHDEQVGTHRASAPSPASAESES